MKNFVVCTGPGCVLCAIVAHTKKLLATPAPDLKGKTFELHRWNMVESPDEQQAEMRVDIGTLNDLIAIEEKPL